MSISAPHFENTERGIYMAIEFELPKNALLIGSLSHLIEASAADLKDFLDLVNHFYHFNDNDEFVITSKFPSLSAKSSFDKNFFNFNKNNQTFYLINRAKGYNFLLETLPKISDFYIREAYNLATLNFKIKGIAANK